MNESTIPPFLIKCCWYTCYKNGPNLLALQLTFERKEALESKICELLRFSLPSSSVPVLLLLSSGVVLKITKSVFEHLLLRNFAARRRRISFFISPSLGHNSSHVLSSSSSQLGSCWLLSSCRHPCVEYLVTMIQRTAASHPPPPPGQSESQLSLRIVHMPSQSLNQNGKSSITLKMKIYSI